MSLTLSTWHLQSLKRVLLVGRITRPQIFRKKLRPAFHRVCSAPLRVEPLVQQEKAVDPGLYQLRGHLWPLQTSSVV